MPYAEARLSTSACPASSQLVFAFSAVTNIAAVSPTVIPVDNGSTGGYHEYTITGVNFAADKALFCVLRPTAGHNRAGIQHVLAPTPARFVSSSKLVCRAPVAASANIAYILPEVPNGFLVSLAGISSTSACGTPVAPQQSCGLSVTDDEMAGWDLSHDYVSDLHEDGNPASQKAGSLYLRLECGVCSRAATARCGAAGRTCGKIGRASCRERV